jgi:hypothetical protein
MKLFGFQCTASVETSLKYFFFSLLFNKLPQGYLFRGREKLLAHGLVALNNQGGGGGKQIEERRARKRYVTGVKLCAFCSKVIAHHHHSLGDDV